MKDESEAVAWVSVPNVSLSAFQILGLKEEPIELIPAPGVNSKNVVSLIKNKVGSFSMFYRRMNL